MTKFANAGEIVRILERSVLPRKEREELQAAISDLEAEGGGQETCAKCKATKETGQCKRCILNADDQKREILAQVLQWRQQHAPEQRAEASEHQGSQDVQAIAVEIAPAVEVPVKVEKQKRADEEKTTDANKSKKGM